MVLKDFFIRNLDADSYRENFLISAVVSIFVIRIFLRLTHYPHLGSGAYHIAHMLWGGFFMLIALIIALSFLSRTALNVASIFGGIGFGTFIDELGKFITSRNDYFFQPTIALIYIVFVLLYLILKFIPHYRAVSKKEYLVNAIELIKESAINDFDQEEELLAKKYLHHCDHRDPIVIALTRMLSRIDAVPVTPGIFTVFRIRLRNWYYKIAGSGLILNIIIVFLVLQTLRSFFETLPILVTRPVLPFNEWGVLYSTSLSGIFVLIGFFALKFSRLEAYRFFRISLLIAIFLTEFFAFMRSQWYELIPLGANVIFLTIINYAIILEKQKEE